MLTGPKIQLLRRRIQQKRYVKCIQPGMEEAPKLLVAKTEQYAQSTVINSASISKHVKAAEPTNAGLPTAQQLQNPGEHTEHIHDTDICLYGKDRSKGTLKSLENQVGQISKVFNSRPIGGFPSDTEVTKGVTHEQCKVISTRSGKVLEPPTKSKQGEITVANPKVTSDTYVPTLVDNSTSAGKDHYNPTEIEEAETPAEATQHKQHRKDTLEEPRPPPPFLQRLRKQKQDYQFKKFFDILKQVHKNLPLGEALQHMPNYVKFLKDMVPRKSRIGEFETVVATETCLAMMHNKVPAKKIGHGSFSIPCLIGHNYSTKALCDPGASINLMPKSVFQKLGIGEAKPTAVMLQLADHSFVQPEEKIEDILIRVDKFIFPANFLILDCEADEHAPIILRRPFLATGRVLLDFKNDELVLRVNDQQVKINIFKTMKRSVESEDWQMIEATIEFHPDTKIICLDREHLISLNDLNTVPDDTQNQNKPEIGNWVHHTPCKYFQPLNYIDKESITDKPSVQQPPNLELKTLPEQLKYAYLGDDNTLLVIISSKL
ncbi:hypothetical protein GQ457_04G021740 [Hibiscus cannabinus]